MKKIIHIFSVLFIFFVSLFSAEAKKINEVFLDINDDYIYIDELEYVYEKGLISPSEDGKFQADRKLTRGEFIAAALKLSCESCLPFDISPRIVADYKDNKSFFDVKKNDEIFYCAEESNRKKYLLRYDPSHICENGVTKEGESPFCSEDTISLQEAIRAILMISKIYTEKDYMTDGELFSQGKIQESIGKDIQARDNSGELNPFFLYLRKALAYSIDNHDIYGELKSYNFLDEEIDFQSLGEPISREQFIYMAYIALKSSGCEDTVGDFSLLIDVYPASCIAGEPCGKDQLDQNARAYDLKANLGAHCSGVPDESGEIQEFDPNKHIVWRLHHLPSNTHEVYMGEYIDNVDFSQEGERLIYLGVFDPCGGTTTAKNTLFIGGETEKKFQLSVEANPISASLGNEISFRALSPNIEGKIFRWDLGDGSIQSGEEISHIFSELGSYKVGLKSEDTTAFIHIDIYKQEFQLATLIDIFPGDCQKGEPCGKADLSQNGDKYDFYANIAGTCEDGVEENNIKWEFQNTNSGKRETKIGGYIDDYYFSEPGLWSINLDLIDKCGRKGSAQSYIQIGPSENQQISLAIEADAINIQVGASINFTALTSDLESEDFTWNFGDGENGVGRKVNHPFTSIGTYRVELESGDNTAYVFINVYKENTQDRDTDGILDVDDLCVDIPGVIENSGCPLLPGDKDGDKVLDKDDDCPGRAGPKTNRGCPDQERDDIVSLCGGGGGGCEPGYICSIFPGGPGEGVCLLDNVCSLSLDGGSYGNVSCNSCPCDYSIDFDSELKVCDLVFPAITSLDGSRIYSQGEAYQILQ